MSTLAPVENRQIEANEQDSGTGELAMPRVPKQVGMIATVLAIGVGFGGNVSSAAAINTIKDQNTQNSLFMGVSQFAAVPLGVDGSGSVAGRFTGNGEVLTTVGGIFSFSDSNGQFNSQPTQQNLDFRFHYSPSITDFMSDPFGTSSEQTSLFRRFDAPSNIGWDTPIETSPDGRLLYRLLFDVSSMNIVTPAGSEQFVSLMTEATTRLPGVLGYMQLSNIPPSSLLPEDLYGFSPGLMPHRPISQIDPSFQNGTYLVQTGGASVPEPSAALMIGAGLTGLALARGGRNRGRDD